MAEILKHPAKPVRAWVARPDGDLWIGEMVGFPYMGPPSDEKMPIPLDMLIDILSQPSVRMGLPIIVNPWATALGGAA